MRKKWLKELEVFNLKKRRSGEHNNHFQIFQTESGREIKIFHDPKKEN